MKKKLFIGSSAEQIDTLHKIVTMIGDVVECTPWTNAFGLNKSALDALIKQTRLSDFAILLATKDDITNKKGTTLETPRDNIVFEFGLFLGVAGPEKCFLLVEEGTGLPSDIDGITIPTFTRTPDKFNSLDVVIKNIVDHIKETLTVSELGLLPSTALAIGYYNSFIRKVCEESHSSGSISIEGKEVKLKSFKINIIIPESLDDSGVGTFTMLYNKKHNLRGASTFVNSIDSNNRRGYPFHFKVDPPDQDMNNPIDIHVSDVPGTLNTIVESLKLYLPTGVVGFNIDMDYLEKRELNNFVSVLQFLIDRNSSTKGYVDVVVDAKI